MTKSKISKDLIKTLKNVKLFGNKMMKSTITLYSVLLLAVLNLFVFIGNEDNESLFLFLVISALVYTKTTNMISVLLIPLISVNLLIYLRKVFMTRHEGFDMDMEFEEFNKWFDNNVVEAEIPSEDDDPEGMKFFEEMVKPVIEFKDKKEPLTLDNMKLILSLYTSLNELSDEETDSSYIKNVVDKFKEQYSTSEEEESEKDVQESEKGNNVNNKKTKDESMATTESFAFLEGFDDEDEDEDEDEF